ncbi:MAG: DMT family transporter [Bacteroidales bacterium]
MSKIFNKGDGGIGVIGRNGHIAIKSLTLVYIEISIAVLFWGFSFIWTNSLIHHNIPIFAFIFFRMAIGGLTMSIIALLLRKFQKVDKADWKWFFLLAVFEPFIYFIFESFGLKATDSPTLAAVIIATIPIFTMITDYIVYKTKMSLLNIIGTIITLPGILLIVLKGNNISVKYWWGIVFLMIAVLSTIGYSIATKNLTNKYNGYTITAYQFIIGSMYFLPFFLTVGQKGFSIDMMLKWDVLYPLLSLAVFCSAICYALYTQAIKNLGITKASVFTAVNPAIAAIGAFLVGQENLSWSKIIGIFIVIFGVILSQRR